MTDKINDVPNRRLTVNEPTEALAHSDEDYDDGLTMRGRGDSTSSLEHYFDQQFHNFPMVKMPAIDWSLRSDEPTEVRSD